MKENKHSQEHIKFLRSVRAKNAFVIAMRIAVLALIIGAWELLTYVGVIDPFIVSSPSRVVNTIANLYNSGEIFRHIGITLYETVVGFIAGTIAGTLIAALLWWNKTLNRILDPYLVVLNALPKIALGPILIVWVGANVESIIVMALLVSVIVTVMTVLGGFLESAKANELLMRTLGASKLQFFTMAVLPSSFPTIVASLKLSIGMSWVGVIVGEYLVSEAGLGYLIVYGGQVFKLDLVMASIVILCVLAAVMYYLVAWFEKVVTRR